MNAIKSSQATKSSLALVLGFSLLVSSPKTYANPFGLWINANSTNSYSDSSKWIPIDGSLPGGVPGPSNDAYIFDGTVQVANGGNFNPQQLIMGWENWHVGEFQQTGGNTRTEYWTKVGIAGNQVFNQSGGTYSAADLAVGWINPATSSVGTGVMNLSGGTFESRAATFIGLEGATGTVNISGGTFNSGGNGWGSFRIADYGTGTGTMNLSGTGTVNAAQYTAVGGNGNGTLNITGGTWNQTTGGIVVGDAADLNWAGRGDVNQSGGTVNADYVFLQKGTYNLNGGNLSAFGVSDTKAERTGVFNFNGGTLRARDNNADFITADTVEIKSGGATIDTTDKEVWITKGMVGSGGLTKTGSGVLRLKGVNTYAGTTSANQGLTFIDGSIAGGLTINSGGAAAGQGSVGALEIASGGVLAPGNFTGTMNAASSIWNGGGTYSWQVNNFLGSAGSDWDLLNISGNLAIQASSGSRFIVDIVSLLANGSLGVASNFNGDNNYSFTIATAAGGISGFDSDYFQVNTANLANSFSGTWGVAKTGNNINLLYTASAATAIPEPATGPLVLIGVASVFLMRRRLSNFGHA
jgi:autotransporter-associated beta strand protein